jgi:hypothetical protein
MSITPIRAVAQPGLTFDEETHRYYVDGAWVRSVTQVLDLVTGPIYARVPPHILDYARDRGQAVHGWTELLDLADAEQQGDIITAFDGTQLLPEHAEWPFVQAWLKFRRESGFEPEIVEQRIWHPKLRYCGTVDRIGLMQGRRATVEIKTVAQLGRWVGLQTVGYHEGFNAGRPRSEQARDRYAVQLRKDGSYRLEQYIDDSGDMAAFVAMKTTWDWADANGVPSLALQGDAA